jgi:hypothetical protein
VFHVVFSFKSVRLAIFNLLWDKKSINTGAKFRQIGDGKSLSRNKWILTFGESLYCHQRNLETHDGRRVQIRTREMGFQLHWWIDQ